MKIGAITLSITPDLTSRLVAALESQTRRPDHSILVANSPRVRERAMKQAFWDQVLYPGFNLSFAIGNNNAERAMPGDITHLLLLNDDLIPSPTFIEELAQAQEDFEAPIVGAMFGHRDGTVNHAGGCELNADLAHGDHIGRGQPVGEFSGVARVPWVTFAGVLVDRSWWRLLGGLDEGFVFGYEDHDFCLRAIQAGAGVIVSRDAVGIHEECATRPRGCPRDAQNYELFRSRWAGEPLRALLTSYKAEFPDAEGIPA